MITTLLLTGANNHDWRRSAPYCRTLLESSGRFSVKLSEQPDEALMNTALEQTQLFFLDYNGPPWSEQAQERFTARIAGGVGLVILHAANNSFPGWRDYEAMCGLLFREAEGSGHGDFHTFTVTPEAPEHPITRGLAPFVTTDELYHRLVSAAGASFEVLARAYADPARRGSGQHEPVALVSRYGEGRIFQLGLGHVWPGDPKGDYLGASMIAFEQPGFQALLLRGAEWAATGGVSLS
jgi:uncharacterized protein